MSDSKIHYLIRVPEEKMEEMLEKPYLKRELLRILIVHEKRCKSSNKCSLGIPNRINENKFLPRHVMKLQNINEKGTRAIREKRHYLQRKIIRLTVDFLSKIMEADR